MFSLSRCVEAIGHEDMIFHTSGVRGMIASEEKVAIPSNDDVLKVGPHRSVGVLTEVILKNWILSCPE